MLLKTGLNYLLIMAGLLTTSAGPCAADYTSSVVWVGSTPGDELIKSQLDIPPSTKVDFIRWNLTLNNGESKQPTFVLTIAFGESKPNTLGFTNDDGKAIFEGTYTVAPNNHKNLTGVICQFTSKKLPTGLMIVKLNDNLLHLLTPQHNLMIGNGGWSYTLNRKEVIKDNVEIPTLTSASTLLNGTSLQSTYEGRTPCQNFAAEHHMNVSPQCFKLKWRLILNRDPITHEPTTYTIRKVVDNIPRDVSGKWTIIKGVKENQGVIIYQIDPENPETAISFLVGDENVLFFLDKRNRLYTGNSDFSFTLNKKIVETK